MSCSQQKYSFLPLKLESSVKFEAGLHYFNKSTAMRLSYMYVNYSSICSTDFTTKYIDLIKTTNNLFATKPV